MIRKLTSTYRIQFGGEMTFAKAAERVPYLADLGISHVYASPVFEARTGSTHGYDVIDPNRLSGALGGEEGFGELSEALKRHDLGLMLDIVPNHMAASEENPWLRDVMLKGEASAHSGIFDIDWKRGGGRLTLPILGAPLEEVIARGELRVEGDSLAYHDRRFPLAEGTGDLPIAELVGQQHYRLSFWRDLDKLNYRRFFDITDLIGVRQEDPAVFDTTHRLIRELVTDGLVDALRVDHIDGLRDPGAYLERLAGLFPGGGPRPPIYVEKILEGHETLPPEWLTAGETGYWFLGRIDRLLIEPSAEVTCTETAPEEGRAPFGDALAEAKKDVISASFSHEFEELAGTVGEGSEDDLTRLARSFSVYRTYLSPVASDAVNARERGRLAAFARTSDTEHLLSVLGDPERDAALRFQQMTGPVTAKSMEDTAYYRHIRFLPINEVGADPTRFALTPEEVHRDIAARRDRHPLAMNATSTHDTKRSEDARARLIALSYRAGAWRDWVARAAEVIDAPNARSRLHLLQAAIAIWPGDGEEEPALRDRLTGYMLKAEREAKRETSWTDQDRAYETALEEMVSALVEGPGAALVREIAEAIDRDAAQVTIARTVLKLTLPGIPDTYQGTEVVDRSLVDPDNRRPPRFADGEGLGALDRRKAAVTRALLRLRRQAPALLVDGDYTPLEAPAGVFAFARSSDDARLDVRVALRPGQGVPALEEESIVAEEAARVTFRTR